MAWKTGEIFWTNVYFQEQPVQNRPFQMAQSNQILQL